MVELQTTISELLKQYKTLSVKSFIITNVLNLISEMHKLGICHGDPHTNNIMVSSEMNLLAIPNEEIRYKLMKYKYHVIDFGSTKESFFRL